MGNVKRLYQALIPILLLPLLGSLAQALLTPLCAASLGAFYMAADSVTGNLYSAAGMALYAAAMAGAALPAVRMEEGKAEAAKKANRWALIVFCLLAAGAAAIFLLMGPTLLQLINSTPEIIDIGGVSLRAGALALMGVSLIAALIGQTRNDCSMTATLIFCGMMTVLGAAAGYVSVFYLHMGVSGLGLSRGAVFAATRIAPFLMIPCKRYAEGFRPQRQEV